VRGQRKFAMPVPSVGEIPLGETNDNDNDRRIGKILSSIDSICALT
jgi:hypothetical protein